MTVLQTLKPLLQQARQQKKGRKAKAKPVYVSRKLELAYTKELLAISRTCQDAANELIIPEVGKNVGDSWFSESLKKLKNKVTGAVDTIAEKLASKTVKAQQREADAQLAQQLEKMTGVDLRVLFRDEDLTKVVDEAIAANTALIKSIPSQYADKVEALILKGLQEGKRAESIAEDIKALGHSTDERARLIARDQLGKINSRISQIRQQKLGITHYRWSTSHDERVRSSHRLRDGQIFAWDSPPPDGHAGQPIRCRCVALPYMDHLVDPDASTPEEAMKSQGKGVGQVSDFDVFAALAANKKASQSVETRSNQLLDSMSNGLSRADLPAEKDKKWGFSHAALRKSEQLFDRLQADGIDPPATWAIHHWTIDSRYIMDYFRPNPALNADRRSEFSRMSAEAAKRINRVFQDKDARLTEPLATYRGTSISPDELTIYENQLKSGNAIVLSSSSFQSSTVDYALAKKFADDGASKAGRLPVIHQTILHPNVKAIDITKYHYYPDDNEILLAQGYKRVVTAIRRKNGVIEMFSQIEPIATKVGDDLPQFDLPDLTGRKPDMVMDVHYDDPRLDAWAGENQQEVYFVPMPKLKKANQ